MYRIESTPNKLSVTVTIENLTSAPIISPGFMNFLREMAYNGLLTALAGLDVPDAVREIVHSLSFLDVYIESTITGEVRQEENEEAVRVIPVLVNALEALGVGIDG